MISCAFWDLSFFLYPLPLGLELRLLERGILGTVRNLARIMVWVGRMNGM